jgi:hypothetical protein
MRATALAYRLLFAIGCAMIAGKTEYARSVIASCARTEDHSPKVFLFGTAVMLNSQFKRNDPTGGALLCTEHMHIIWVTVSSNAFTGIFFKV